MLTGPCTLPLNLSLTIIELLLAIIKLSLTIIEL